MVERGKCGPDIQNKLEEDGTYYCFNTVRQMEYDGRFSPDNKKWSHTILAPCDNLSAEIKDLELQMSDNAELQKQIVNYAKTRAVYAEYCKSGYSKKFRAEHEAEILLHQAAKKYFDSLGDKKLPNVRALREQYQVFLAQKRKAYSAYKQAREEMKELYNVKSNVEHLLNISEHDTEREREKTRR